MRKFYGYAVRRNTNFQDTLRGFRITASGNQIFENTVGDFCEATLTKYDFEELLMLQTFCLGNSLLFKYQPHQVFTHHELHKILPEDLPHELQIESEHRPGAVIQKLSPDNEWEYWAVECDLKKRSYIYYEKIFDFYLEHKQFKKVFWIVTDNAALIRLLEITHQTPEKDRRISFVLASDLAEQVWVSKVFLGIDQHRKISEIFGQEYVDIGFKPEVPTFGMQPQDYVKDTLLNNSRIFGQIACPYRLLPKKPRPFD